MASVYRPGKGLDKNALSRLRDRRDAGAAHVIIPSEDTSEQRGLLIGLDAKKVPRCSVCTRPTDEDLLFCSSCRTLPASSPWLTDRSAAVQQDKKHRASAQGTLTPSTDVASEDGYEAQDEFQQSHEILRNSEYEYGICEAKPLYQHCPEQAVVRYGGFATSGEHRSTKENQSAYIAGRLAAMAIREIREQLGTQGNRGFVWINNWNARYSRHLGSLRCFLEGHPDKFTVIPQSGKSFRVAAVQDAAAK